MNNTKKYKKRFYLYCLKCKKKYSIPSWVMKRIGYRQYSYCNNCYCFIEGKKRSLLAKMFTKNLKENKKNGKV